MAPKNSQGFTLIEILIVVAIIGVLTTVLVNNLIRRAGEAKIELAYVNIQRLEQALEMYRLDCGRYPTEEQGLAALVREPSGERPCRRYNPGGYVKADAITDPWGEPYRYRSPGEHNTHSFDIFSLGPDGVEGGEGEATDIGNWTAELL